MDFNINKYKISYPTYGFVGTVLTEIGALASWKNSWRFVGRYALCGGGFLSTLWLSQYYISRGEFEEVISLE